MMYGNPISDIRVQCPFCITEYGSEDTKHKLYISINPDKPFVHCFRCGYKASWINFVIAVTGLDYIHAYGELYVSLMPDHKYHQSAELAAYNAWDILNKAFEIYNNKDE